MKPICVCIKKVKHDTGWLNGNLNFLEKRGLSTRCNISWTNNNISTIEQRKKSILESQKNGRNTGL